jgi:hypothetical protein
VSAASPKDETMLSDAPLKCLVISLALGAICELASSRLRLWRYATRATLFANIIIMFGVVQGGLIAGVVGGTLPLGDILPLLLMLGAVTGLIHEGLNEFVVHGWTWSDAPLLGLTRSRDKAAAVGVLWGLAPVTVAILARSFWPS